MNNRELAQHIFLSGIRAVIPARVISDLISVRGNTLKIGPHSADLSITERIFVIGAGKASAAMAHYVEVALGNRITDGHVVTKYGHFCQLRRIKVTEAGHPVPDENSFEATKEIVKIAGEAGENDLVICLISGGGSALLADIPEGCTPEEIARMNDLLVKSGADIREINTVRKHISLVKGGNLMKHIWPATCYTVIISDVTNDPPDIIASGPTVPDDSTYSDALKVLENRQLTGSVAPSILEYLRSGTAGKRPENPKSGDEIFLRNHTLIAGNNKMALLAAAEEARAMDMTAEIITSEMYGDPKGACEYVIDTSLKLGNEEKLKKPLCLLFGGETAIKVSGEGKGGRNLHLALEAVKILKDKPGITLLAGGTDGNDGNSDVAGAVADWQTSSAKRVKDLDPQDFLNRFDSYNYFRLAGGLVDTGPTMTNVMDMIVVIIE